MRSAVYQPGGLQRTRRVSILPLLEEHHYGDGADIPGTNGLDGLPVAVGRLASAPEVGREAGRVPASHLYQLLAYCTVLGLPVGHLVYAKGNEDAQQYAVRNTGVTIIAHTLDLQLNPPELPASLDVLAERMWQASGLGGTAGVQSS
jgi:hypothetical protein